MNKEDLKLMNEIAWEYEFKLESGITTPGRKKLGSKFKKIQTLLPNDLTGKSVIDIGAWDGVFSFEAEKRGANVTAIDKQPMTEGFKFLHRILNSNVRYKQQAIEDFCIHAQPAFDIVLCLGVLYHVENPIIVLRKVYNLVNDNGFALIETTQINNDNLGLNQSKRPFYTFRTKLHPHNGKKETHWDTNFAGLKILLKFVGFKNIELSHRGIKQELPRMIVKAER